MALESIVAEGWLYQVLSGDAQLAEAVGGRIYNSHAPQGCPRPFVVYSYYAGYDVNNGMFRLMTVLFYLAKVICERRDDVVRLAADRIDEVLSHQSNSVAFGFVFHSWRKREVSYPETDARTNRTYLHLGGLYRVETHPQP